MPIRDNIMLTLIKSGAPVLALIYSTCLPWFTAVYIHVFAKFEYQYFLEKFFSKNIQVRFFGWANITKALVQWLFIWCVYYFNARFCFILKYFTLKSLYHIKRKNNKQSTCMKPSLLFHVGWRYMKLVVLSAEKLF